MEDDIRQLCTIVLYDHDYGLVILVGCLLREDDPDTVIIFDIS